VLNDANGDLVRLYRVVQHHLDEFVRHFRWVLTSRELYTWLKATPPATLTDIQRAARFYLSLVSKPAASSWSKTGFRSCLLGCAESR